jgi:hypothetical protein
VRPRTPPHRSATRLAVVVALGLSSLLVVAGAGAATTTTTARAGSPTSTAPGTTTTKAPTTAATPKDASLTSLGPTLTPNVQLSPIAELVSQNGQFTARLNQRCRLVIAGSAGAIWTSSNVPLAAGCPTGFLEVSSGGAIVIVASPSAHIPSWYSGAAAGPSTTLMLTDTGDLVQRTQGGLVAWQSAGGVTGNTGSSLAMGQVLASGSSITSPNGAYTAMMGSDGNFFVVHNGVGAIWWTATWGNPGAYVYLRAGDSSMLVLGAGFSVKWASGTAGMIGTHLHMGNGGLLRLMGPVGTLWDSVGNGTGTVVWKMPTNVGVYAYGNAGRTDCAFYSQPLCDGWPIVGITGGLGEPGSPWVDTSQSSDLATGQAIAASGHNAPWLSFWTVSGPGDCTVTTDNSLAYYIAGFTAGQKVAAKIDAYGLPIKPTSVILDPEGYPDDHSGLDCWQGPGGTASATDIHRYSSMLQGWSAGLHSVDGTLNAGFYATMSEYRDFRLATVTTATTDTSPGQSIPAFLAVAFGYSGNSSYPLIDPSPISSAIPYGAAQVAASNIKGIIAFYAGVPLSVECGPWTGVAAQVLADWGAALNTLQFDPGTTCPA